MIEEALARAGLPPLPRPAWLEIDQDALAANLGTVRALVGPSVPVAAVVKSDGYGHGLEVAARTFLAAGAARLCVATLDEALALRGAGVTVPIIVLFSIPPTEVAVAAEARLELVAADAGFVSETLARWRAVGGPAPVRWHLEVETGLSRAGIAPDTVPAVAGDITSTPGNELVGLWTHLATPDDAAVSRHQRARLQEAAQGMRRAGLPVPPIHVSATGGLFGGTDGFDGMVRPGLCLYGELPAELPLADRARDAGAALRPGMTLHCRPLRISEVSSGTAVGYGGRWRAERASRIATLPVGYGDGYARAYQPGGEALVRGRRVPLVGTVAMDALAVDVTDVPGASLTDDFVLLGRQGDESITADELARRRTTISWEVLVSMAHRLPRVYYAGAGLTGVRTLAGEVLIRGDPHI